MTGTGAYIHDPRTIRHCDAYRAECPHCDWIGGLSASSHVAAIALEDHVELEHAVQLQPELVWKQCTADPSCPHRGLWGAAKDPLAPGWERPHRWHRTGNDGSGFVVHATEFER